MSLMLLAAAALGFATTDLTQVERPAAAALGTGTIARAEPQRLTLSCATCPGAPVVDVQLGRSTDGTEERVRSGATTMAALERLCRAREPACRLAALEVAPAVGWTTSWPMGGQAGVTAVILRDGALLTVRALAGDAPAARGALNRLLPVLREQVVGP